MAQIIKVQKVVLFDDKTNTEKLAHVEKCLDKAYREFCAENPCPLADIVDTWDYWCPWLISRIKELEAKHGAD